MMTIRYLAAGAALACAMPAQAATYVVFGNFLTQSGAIWQTLSGGSFSGSFTVADGFFPRAPETSAYLYDAPFEITIRNAAGTVISTLRNTGASSDYLQIASTYTNIYGAQRIFFRITSTDYLQLIVPINFTGTGAIVPNPYNYALVLGRDYATVSSGSVALATAAVPEPATWSLMIAGFGMVGAAVRRRRSRVRVAFAA